jgi:hypothetical protein
MASYTSTLKPAWLSTSAAINPAGPPPMMATVCAERGVSGVMGEMRIIEVGRAFYPSLMANERPVDNY